MALAGPPRSRENGAAKEAIFTPVPVRNVQDALYPSGHPCRFESSATRIRCHKNAKHPELMFRARLTGEVSEVELALI
jgi:pyrrolidone-carboxylate peptidase